MLKLDNNLLNELGLGGLPEDQKRAMLQHIYETLELRVGTDLANQMTDQQLEEFEKFIDEGGDANQAQALQWLESNLPNYKQVVNEVFEALKSEVRQMAPQLMASSQQQQQAMPQGQPQPQAPMSQPQQPMAQPGYPSALPDPQPLYGQTPNGYQQAPQPMQQPSPTYQQPMQPQSFAPATQPMSAQGGYQPAPQGFQPPQAPASYQQPQQPAVDPMTGQPIAQQPPQYPTQ